MVKAEKIVSWLVIITICLMVIFGGGFVLKEVIADTAQPEVTVSNSNPTVGAVILNGGTAISLTENNSTTISGTTTITDANGWDDISTMTSTLYLQNSSCDSGAADANWCYYMGSCTTDSTTTNSRDITCSAEIWFIAEPTTPTTSYATSEWEMDITVVDAASASDTGTTSQHLNTMYAFDLDSSISYGSIAVGATGSETSTNATNTGNFAVDFSASGDDMDDSGGGHTIAVGQQHYSSSTGFAYASGTALTSGASSFNVDMPKSTSTSSPTGEIVYWMIQIPAVQYATTYTGTNTIELIDTM